MGLFWHLGAGRGPAPEYPSNLEGRTPGVGEQRSGLMKTAPAKDIPVIFLLAPGRPVRAWNVDVSVDVHITGQHIHALRVRIAPVVIQLIVLCADRERSAQI